MKKFIIIIMLISVLGGMFSPMTAKASSFSDATEDVMIWVADSTLSLAGKALWLSGKLLDASIEFSLYTLQKSQSPVSEAWKAGRDIANIFFIFILLYIAIATILQIEGFGTKSLLVKVVLAALLVNFSLVITQMVIDASNVLSIALLDNIKGYGNGSLSEAFMRGLRLESLYDVSGGGVKVGAFEFTAAKMLTIMVFGSSFILVAAFVFLVAAILFIIRSIVLIFLMILSPLAFLAWVLPGTSAYAQKWWKTLFDQSFFAPAYLFVITAVLLVLRGRQGDLGDQALNKDNILDIEGNTFVAALVGSSGSFSIILNFVILIGMMLAAPIVAKSMGAYGAETVINRVHAARKWGQGVVGRNTVGRGASLIAESQIFKNALGNKAGRVLGGRHIAQGLQTVSGYGFGGAKGGYTGAVKQTATQQGKFGEYLGKGAGGVARQEAYAKRLEGGKIKQGFSKYTGIGSAAQQSAKNVQKMSLKTVTKEKRENTKKQHQTELDDLEKQKNILPITPAEMARLEEIKQEIDAKKKDPIMTGKEQIDTLEKEAGDLRARKKHHDRIAELQKEIMNAKERDEQSKEMDKMTNNMTNKILKSLEERMGQ